MGCDIHFFVERYEHGAWVARDNWQCPDPPKDPHHNDPALRTSPNPPRPEVEDTELLCWQRNYFLFAILGNQGRNSWDIEPIRPNNYYDLPDDVSTEVKQEFVYDGGHSVNWLSLDAILDYNWAQTREMTARVSERDAEILSWDRSHHPDMWVSAETTYDSYLEKYPKIATWKYTYAQRCTEFWVRTIPGMLALQAGGEVRCVYWFDN